MNIENRELSQKLVDTIDFLKQSISKISVYDLNYYSMTELYYGIANKINELIETYHEFGVSISEEVVKQNECLQYLLNDGLIKEVVNKINQMVANGTMDTIINHNIFNDLNSQIKEKAYRVFVTPYEFGAEKDKDSTQAFKDMINYAHENKLSMMIPKHNFIISDTLPIYSDMVMYGENGSNSINDSCHIKFTGQGYLFDCESTLINIEFRNLVFLGVKGSPYSNSCMKISCQRFKLIGCSIMYFQNCVVLNAINQNVVENVISDNLLQFCNVGIDVINNNNNEFLYSDCIIHNNFIATYKECGIKGYMAQFKITNNQIYTSELSAKADLLFGGYLNYINNNNFGGKTSNIIYDNVLYQGNLYENIISNNMFINPPVNNTNLYCIVIKTNTIAKLLISNNIFGCERFDSNGSGKKYAVYCQGSGYQTSQIINNQGYLYKHIGGDEGTRVNDLYIVGYDKETKGYRIGSSISNEKLILGDKLEIGYNNGVPPTNANNKIGGLISDVSNGNLYISRGQYGNQRCITVPAEGTTVNIDMTSNNKIRDTQEVTKQYPVGDIIIDPNNGNIYISKGSYGNKKLLTES